MWTRIYSKSTTKVIYKNDSLYFNSVSHRCVVFILLWLSKLRHKHNISSFLQTHLKFSQVSSCRQGTECLRYQSLVTLLYFSEVGDSTLVTSTNMAVVLQSLFDIIKTLPQ